MLLIDYLDEDYNELHRINTQYLIDISLKDNVVTLHLINNDLKYKFDAKSEADEFVRFVTNMFEIIEKLKGGK